MTQHRWVALGGGPMTAEQAAEWADMAGGGTAETSIEVFFSTMLCAVCLEVHEDALPICPGLPEGDDNDHVWHANFTAPATDDEAAAWADPDGDYDSGRPRSVAVYCVLCGATPDDPAKECDERAFWTKESSIELDPTDFVSSSDKEQGGDASEVGEDLPGDANMMRKLSAESAVMKRTRLINIGALPELETEHADFIITEEWRDFSDARELESLEEKSLPCFVVRARAQELWCEVASYESWRRLPELKRLLRDRYGSRMDSFTPPPLGTFTYGDDLNSPQKLEKALREVDLENP